MIAEAWKGKAESRILELPTWMAGAQVRIPSSTASLSIGRELSLEGEHPGLELALGPTRDTGIATSGLSYCTTRAVPSALLWKVTLKILIFC